MTSYRSARLRKGFLSVPGVSGACPSSHLGSLSPSLAASLWSFGAICRAEDGGGGGLKTRPRETHSHGSEIQCGRTQPRAERVEGERRWSQKWAQTV